MPKRSGVVMSAPGKRVRRGKRRAVRSTDDVAREALALAKKSLREIETKRYDLFVTTNVDNAGFNRDLGPLVKGIDENDRVGSRVTSTRIRFKFIARPHPSATGNVTFVRVVLAINRFTGNFLSTDYFEHAGVGEQLISQRGFDSMANYKTLVDKTFELDGGASAVLSGAAGEFSVSVPGYVSHNQWDGAGNHEKNSPWLIMASNQAAATAPEVKWTARYEYTDA